MIRPSRGRPRASCCEAEDTLGGWIRVLGPAGLWGRMMKRSVPAWCERTQNVSAHKNVVKCAHGARGPTQASPVYRVRVCGPASTRVRDNLVALEHLRLVFMAVDDGQFEDSKLRRECV
jgi:hypothetical protein